MYAVIGDLVGSEEVVSVSEMDEGVILNASPGQTYPD
jgi:hypothetical protein